MFPSMQNRDMSAPTASMTDSLKLVLHPPPKPCYVNGTKKLQPPPANKIHDGSGHQQPKLPLRRAAPPAPLLPSRDVPPAPMLPSRDVGLPPAPMLPSRTAQPEPQLPSRTAPQEPQLPSRTAPPEPPLLPSRTSQPEPQLPSRTAPPEPPLLPSRTAPPEPPLLPSRTSQPEPLLPSRTAPPEPQLPSRTAPQEPQLPSRTAPQEPQLPSRTSPSAHIPPTPQLSVPTFSQNPDQTEEYLQPTLQLPMRLPGNVPNPPQKNLPHQHSISESSNYSHRSPHCLLRRRNLVAVSFVSLILSLASLSMLVLIIINPFNYKWQTQTFKEGGFKACVKCVYLMQSTMDNNEEIRSLYNENRGGEMFCCARRSEEINNLLKLIMKQQDYKPKPQIKVSQNITPYAHQKLIYASIKTHAVPDGHFIMKIKQEQNGNFYNQSVSVRQNSFVIEVSGWYYVYSNIYYHTKCDNSTTVKTVEHNILLLSPQNPVRGGSLVKTSYTCCADCKKSDHQSSFTGGVFELSQGDKIFTSVTDVDAVNFDSAPYLGVVMIGG